MRRVAGETSHMATPPGSAQIIGLWPSNTIRSNRNMPQRIARHGKKSKSHGGESQDLGPEKKQNSQVVIPSKNTVCKQQKYL